MDKKLVSIVSIVMAIVFVGVFIVVWDISKDIIGLQQESIKELYRSDVAFDISLYDNKLVSGSSIINLKAELNSIGYTNSLDIEINTSTVDSSKTYYSTLGYNENGVLESINLELRG